MATTYDLVKYLSANDVEYSLLTHESVGSADELAKTLRLPVRMVVQTTLMKVEEHCWMIVMPADQKINLGSLCRVLGSENVHPGDASDWNMYLPNCNLNTLPPFGNLYGMSVIVDKSLEQGRRIVFGAYSSTQSVFMRWETYISLVHPIVAKICDESTVPLSYKNNRLIETC